MAEEQVKLIKLGDGTVQRNGICSCGHTFYKKNLTTGKITFIVRGRAGDRKIETLEVYGDQPTIKLTCPECEMGHIIQDVKEFIIVVENSDLTKDKEMI